MDWSNCQRQTNFELSSTTIIDVFNVCWKCCPIAISAVHVWLWHLLEHESHYKYGYGKI